jgi:hypothetical protein
MVARVQVHRGFYELYLDVQAETMAAIRQLADEHDVEQIYFTGLFDSLPCPFLYVSMSPAHYHKISLTLSLSICLHHFVLLDFRIHSPNALKSSFVFCLICF